MLEQKEAKTKSNRLGVYLILILFLILFLFFLTIIYFSPSKTIITNCGDDTLPNQCSSNQPYFCFNGTLIQESSVCGCPAGLKKIGETCFSEYQTNPRTINLEYIFDGDKNSMVFTVYGGLVNYLEIIPKSISGVNLSKTDFRLKNLNEPSQRELLLPLITQIQNLAPEKIDQAKIAISLVQNIPYGNSEKNATFLFKPVPYSRLPYEVLYDQEGVCGEKSELLAFLLREIGYDVAFIYYPKENHEAIGIKCLPEHSLENSNYCFVETTAPSIISDDEIIYAGGFRLSSNPEIIQISEGLSLPSNLEEYKDAEDWKIIRNKLEQEKIILNPFKEKKLIDKYGLVEVYRV